MEDVVLHSVMTKRSQGQNKLFGRINFKERLFMLSSQSVKYSTGKSLDKPGMVKGEIKLGRIQVVEDVVGEALASFNGFPFQIVYNNGTASSTVIRLYIVAGLRKDKEEWVAKLRNFVAQNESLEPCYHPGIFEKITNTIKWSCCGSLAMESRGCQNSYFHVDEVEKREARSRQPDRTAAIEGKGGKLFVVVALYDLTAQDPRRDLNLRRGEKLDVLDTEMQHWWKARNETGQVGLIPESYVVKDGIEGREWFHEIGSRVQAEVLLQEHGRDCTFLVRPSAKVNYSISLYNAGLVKHYHIQEGEGKFWVNDRYKFDDVDKLLGYHEHNCAGMMCRLRYPLNKTNANSPPLIGNQFGDFLIKSSEVTYGVQIGQGQFGVVYKGSWKGYTVAIKTMKEGSVNSDDFFDEAKIMMHFKNANLIRFYGIVNDGGVVAILTEFMAFGCLYNYLHEHPNIPAQTSLVIDMCRQIAMAMKFLEDNNFIHRDLAARNCLVGHQQTIKVADFGLSRFVEDDEYTASEGAKFPIKWSSPEVIAYGRYSSKSDIWSFGVTVWEILSGGQVPYRELTNNMVFDKLREGYRLPPPRASTPQLSRLMEQCWYHNPEDRITFGEIITILETLNFEF